MRALTLTLSVGLLLSIFTEAQAAPAKKIALIYNGPGACIDENDELQVEREATAQADPDFKFDNAVVSDCALQAAQIAKMAGYKPKFVTPDALAPNASPEKVYALFESARVWIQPGGVANQALYTMSPTIRWGIKKFVEAGGGYVGFCAGAFMATEMIGGTTDPGLGILPGRTYLYRGGFSLEPVSWFGKLRQIYFEGGPYFYAYEPEEGDKTVPKVEVVATYENGATAAVRTTFGKGKVWVTGLHPEAPLRWTKEDDVVDPDGAEQILAAGMVKWAASPVPVKMSPATPRKRRN